MDLQANSTTTWAVAAVGAASVTLALAALVAGRRGAATTKTFAQTGPNGTQETRKRSAPPEWRAGMPLVGPFMAFASDPLGTVSRARKDCGDVFTIRLLTEKVTFLVGPVPHQAFFEATDEMLDQADVYSGFMTPIFGKGVVYDVELVKRRQQLRGLGAALKPANLKVYPPIIADETARYFASRWSQASGQADIHTTFADLIIKTGSATLMGPEIRNEMFEEMYRLYQDLDKGLQPLSVFFPHAPTAAHAKRDKARKEIGVLFSKIIQRRKASLGDAEARGAAGSGGGAASADLVQRMMDFAYADGTKLTDDEIAGMMVATLFAAQHTSNVTATWTTLFLLDDKRRGGNYLDRVLEEMRAVEPFPGAFASGQGIDYNVLAKQPFLYACVKEAIRMYPPIIFLMRRALVDLPVGNDLFVPKGSMVMVSNAVAQRLPEVFERPDEYLPDRFLASSESAWDITKLPKYSFIGFGAGIHTCLGESFAFLQVRTILNVLFSQYELKLETEFPTPDYESIVVMPHGPNIVSYKRIDAAAKFAGKVAASSGASASGAPSAAAPVTLHQLAAEVDTSTKYSRAEVAKHTKADDCWIIVRGKVYDVSNYLHLHQGGDEAILRVAGTDATEQVEGPQHPGTVPQLLQRFLIGVCAD